jgi:phosphonate degradation associated HDIG domain protein
MRIADAIRTLFETQGRAAYHGEAVSQAEHALQSAQLAEAEGAPDSLVVAALLHDVGHLISGHEEDAALRGVDDGHETAGAAWLSLRFGPDVVEPIRLHVAAKRYLCAVEPEYSRGLSPASLRSLQLQGGPSSAEERAAFEANPHHRAAVRLRRWDDAAKVPGLAVPGLDHYLARIEAAATGATWP